jgi:tetratricopeptide (TPR) repeat protein
LRVLPNDPPEVRLRLWSALGAVAFAAGRYARAYRCFMEAGRVLRGRDPERRARVALNRAMCAWALGKWTEAEGLLRWALPRLRARFHRCVALQSWAMCALERGRFRRAEQRLAAARRLARRLGDAYLTRAVFVNSALVYAAQGRCSTALAWLERAASLKVPAEWACAIVDALRAELSPRVPLRRTVDALVRVARRCRRVSVALDAMRAAVFVLLRRGEFREARRLLRRVMPEVRRFGSALARRQFALLGLCARAECAPTAPVVCGPNVDWELRAMRRRNGRTVAAWRLKQRAWAEAVRWIRRAR